MPTLSLIQKIAVWALPVLFAITLHEAAHAWAAKRCGDTTAQRLGRLSLNPLRHVDPVGTILVPLLVGALSGFQFMFGWAKPVPIQWSHLRYPRRDMALVGAAGPAANLIMALLWTACFKIATLLHPETSTVALFLLLVGQAGLLVNLFLAFLNLIPIPPLDGSRIMESILPPRLARQYLKLEPFGFIILLALLLTGLLSWLVNPLMSGAITCLQALFNI